MKVTYNISELFPILAAKHGVLSSQIEITGAVTPLAPAFAPRNPVNVDHFRRLWEMINDNYKIGAIKLFRSEICPGAGLKESKDIVEFLTERGFGKTYFS